MTHTRQTQPTTQPTTIDHKRGLDFYKCLSSGTIMIEGSYAKLNQRLNNSLSQMTADELSTLFANEKKVLLKAFDERGRQINANMKKLGMRPMP